jgi:hypothetical protein
MLELNDAEQDALLQLLHEEDFPCALATLVHWAGTLNSVPTGEQRQRIQDWKVSPEPEIPRQTGADDLSGNIEFWRKERTLHLIRALDERIHSDWQTASKTALQVRTLDGTRYWLVRKHALPPTRADRIAGIRHYLVHTHFIPAHVEGHEIVLHEIAAPLAGRLTAAQASKVTAYLAHYVGGVAVNWTYKGKGFVLAESLGATGAHEEAAKAHLTAAETATFLVLPECTAPALLRRTLANHLARMRGSAPLLSILGSWHDEAPGNNPPYRNETECYDNRGSALFRYVKTQAAVANGRQEFITLHNTFHALVTPLGLVGVAICLDFSSPAMTCQRAWEAIAPEWMLVPSMGGDSTVDMHVIVAKQLTANHRTVSLVANQAPDGPDCPGVVVDRRGVATGVTNRLVRLSSDAQ